MNGFKQQTFDNYVTQRQICPVLDNHEPDCYCHDMSSMKIPYAVKYCLRDFRQCDIYQRVKLEGRC
jgi:hypothetical protein